MQDQALLERIRQKVNAELFVSKELQANYRIYWKIRKKFVNRVLEISETKNTDPLIARRIISVIWDEQIGFIHLQKYDGNRRNMLRKWREVAQEADRPVKNVEHVATDTPGLKQENEQIEPEKVISEEQNVPAPSLPVITPLQKGTNAQLSDKNPSYLYPQPSQRPALKNNSTILYQPELSKKYRQRATINTHSLLEKGIQIHSIT